MGFERERNLRVLGFDETNNGFSLPHEPFLIITGVLGEEGRGYGTPAYGSKNNRRFFGKVPPSKEELLRAARTYLSSHKDFFYATIPKPSINMPSNHLNRLKAETIAAISFEFFKKYSLPEKTPIYIHQIDGLKESFFVEHYLETIFYYAGISRPNIKVLVRYKEKDLKSVVKQADITGYYLAALKIHLGLSRWPLRKNKVPLRRLEDLIFYWKHN